MQESENPNQADQVFLARVSLKKQKGSYLCGELSSTMKIFLYPPVAKVPQWKLAIGSAHSRPRLLARLLTTPEGNLVSEKNGPWMARKIINHPGQAAWDIFFLPNCA
ncbi:MAG: hypothetical protein EXR99_15155 [Gemmataceae bacterium]|nr:hypothetical protein [Gemmataceae bacterium]